MSGIEKSGSSVYLSAPKANPPTTVIASQTATVMNANRIAIRDILNRDRTYGNSIPTPPE
jgi:hypothetical protein